MKPRIVLLLTGDEQLRGLLTDSLHEGGGVLLQVRSITDALRIVCGRAHELDLAVIDFTEGPHGMTLLSALKACRPELPIIATIANDTYHATTLAYANEVTACLAKPINLADLQAVIRDLGKPQPQLGAA
jgi:DNA-binding NtrC family response regulator